MDLIVSVPEFSYLRGCVIFLFPHRTYELSGFNKYPKYIPSRHMTSIQRRFNVDATS